MSDDHRESPFFRAWALLVLRFRWPLLLLTALVTAVAVQQIVTKLRFDSSTEYFAASDAEGRATLAEFRAEFGRDDLYMVIARGDVFSPAFLARLEALHGDLEAIQVEVSGAEPAAAPAAEAFGDFGDDAGWGDEDGGSVIEEVTSLLDFRQTVFEDGGIRVRGLLDPMPPPEALPALKARALADPSLVGTVVGAEGQHAVLSVRTRILTEQDSFAVQDAVAAIARAHDAPGFTTFVAGLPGLNASLNRLVQEDMDRLVGLAFLVMGVVLLWLFRHPLGVGAPLVVVALASVWTLGAMAATDTPVTLLSNIVPAFLACVGLGDSVHIQSVYRDSRARGMSNDASIVHALGSTGLPILFTTATTAVGLLSFQFASTHAIQEMGVAGAFGVVVAMLHSMVFLPIALSFAGNARLGGGGERGRDRIDALLDACTALSASPRGRALTLGGAGLVVAVALGGVARLDVYHNPLIWLGDEPVAVGITEMDANVGGTASVNLVIESKGEHGMKDLELLRAMEQLDAHIRAYVHPKTGARVVTNTISLLDVVKETNRALHGGDPTFYALPDTQRGVSDALLLFENAGPDELRKLATADLRKSHLTVRIQWMDATSYGPLRDHLDAGIAATIGDRAIVRPTGSVYDLLSVVSALIGDLLRSFGVACLAITAMMVLVLRDLKIGLISMVPNLVPIAFVMGFMGYVGIDIDMSNLLIASIVIGLAVDDTIHYLHQYQVGRRGGLGVEDAVQHALSHAGRAMVSTSVILSLGFGVYTASRLANIQRFGVLVGMACFFALFVDLIVTPALLRWLDQRRISGAKDEAPRSVA